MADEPEIIRKRIGDRRGKPNTGRPTKRKDSIEVQRLIITASSLGLPMYMVSALAEIDQKTIRRWMNRDSEFRRKVKSGKAKTVANLTRKALELCDSKSEQIRLHAIWRLLSSLDPTFRANNKIEPEAIEHSSDESYL